MKYFMRSLGVLFFVLGLADAGDLKDAEQKGTEMLRLFREEQNSKARQSSPVDSRPWATIVDCKGGNYGLTTIQVPMEELTSKVITKMRIIAEGRQPMMVVKDVHRIEFIDYEAGCFQWDALFYDPESKRQQSCEQRLRKFQELKGNYYVYQQADKSIDKMDADFKQFWEECSFDTGELMRVEVGVSLDKLVSEGGSCGVKWMMISKKTSAVYDSWIRQTDVPNSRGECRFDPSHFRSPSPK